ncbi:hypothetical protein TrST_g11040 [Triparma strigata]|uniref:Geranylgeranyl transferase type-2 subunit alpha n=1 Tax=Triparma strigata TaxID=1606541 RepID=A0A9W6ZEP3_9STRA|nr:hypothetical protein TrST_g11040 [Triparma strigata]
MHGRNRIEYEAKVSNADFTKALTKKVINYTALVKACNARKAKKVSDNETLKLTGTVLGINPDYATLWNYRREMIKSDSSPGAVGTWTTESEITNKCLQKNPKSYPSWFHRKWSFLHFVEDSSVQEEIELTTNFLKLDERNFHCWNYRRFLISQSLSVSSLPTDLRALLCSSGFAPQLSSPPPSPPPSSSPEILPLLQSELNFTTHLISSNFSNYSAYHYRSHLLPLILHLQTLGQSPAETYSAKLSQTKEELKLLQSAIFTEPSDQSSWWYYRHLLNSSSPPPSNSITPEKKIYAELLHSTTSPLRELISLEMSEGFTPGSKWALNILHYILETLDALIGMNLGDDADEILDMLILSDEDKKLRYLEIKNEKVRKKTEVLFVFQERGGGEVFLEVRRGRGEGPKDKYVSWFRMKEGKASRLKFKSWDKENGVRMFETGALQVDAEGAGWISGEGLMELVKRKKTDVERDVVNKCLRVWD